MSEAKVRIPKEQVASFCERHHIRELALFGSVLRDDFRPDSDIDVLAQFETGQVPSLFGMAEIEMELSEIMGRKVDLRTPAEIGRFFRERVLESREIVHVAS